MRRIAFLGLGLALLASCSSAGKFSASKPDYRGYVEFGSWPALSRGVAGYNLYMAKESNADFDKINDLPITGGKTMIPYLDPGHTYYFKLTSVGINGMESKPGAVFKRAALAAAPPQ